MTSPNKWFPVRPDGLPMPQTVSDTEFILRNIAHSETVGLDIPDTYLQNMRYVYPGSLTRDTINTMRKDEFDDWKREQRIRRGDVCPSKKWWQDLNSGRRYERGVSDHLDQTIIERNNFASGWFNAKCNARPGGAPFRNPYDEEVYNPDLYESRVPANGEYINKHYHYSIYDLH